MTFITKRELKAFLWDVTHLELWPI